jgi:hypothetical protein
LLSRIPAVKWAFTRLRPPPHGGSIDVAPIAANEQPAATAIADAAPALDSLSAEPVQRDAETAATPVVEHHTAISVITESPSAAPTDIGVGDEPSLEPPAEVELVIPEEISISSVEIESEPVDAPQVLSSDTPAEHLANVDPEFVKEVPDSSADVEISPVEISDLVVSGKVFPDAPAHVAPAVAEQVFVAPVEIELAPIEASDPVIDDETVSVAAVETEPVAVDETPVIVVDIEVPAPAVVEASIDSDPAPSVVTEIEPAPVSPAPEIRSAAKSRAKAAEPVDRATLIRQRWTETGIRMWNPRLHGTGDATLNIQGRIELLPPEPGETMPRYDKLEFKMLGGQIVCEGVIVEAPAHASQRSFTRLAEPRGTDRTRGLVRERQAALA